MRLTITSYCRLTAALCAWMFLTSSAPAQIAITEVMAFAYWNQPSAEGILPGPDYFELTNFGNTPVDLTDYQFSDSGTDSKYGKSIGAPFFDGLVIQPGESIVVFELDSNVIATNAMQFAQWWWGDTNLDGRPRIFCYSGSGLSNSGDEVWLYDENGDVTDMVAFGESLVGRAFIYDSDTGIFGTRCDPNDDGCFKAASADDYGSPGTTVGAVPLQILGQPPDHDADAGTDLTFSIVTGGLPRPAYQWRFNGEDIPGARGSSLWLPNVQAAQAGSYTVFLDNGFETLESRMAQLTINTNPTPPTIISAPSDLLVYVGQCAEFHVAARGYPSLQYQWHMNGQSIEGATNRSFLFEDATLDLSGAVYSVRVWNTNGTEEVEAQLTVTTRPILSITEIMTAPTNSLATEHQDWFELTNGDTMAVNLQGYRFRDGTTLEKAYVVTNDVTIHPGESIIFVKEMTPAAFREWWGADHLPPHLQIVTFYGFGFKSQGEELYLWNGAAKGLDTVASASTVMALPGVSLECDVYCDEDFGCISDGSYDSVEGERGAFRALISGDIGSPGYVENPGPRIARISVEEGGTVVHCRVVLGRSYQLYFSDSPNGLFAPLQGPITADNSLMQFYDPYSENRLQGYYKLEELP